MHKSSCINVDLSVQASVSYLISQAIIWTYAGILLIRPWGTNFNEKFIEIDVFSFKECIWKCRLRNVGHFVSA